MLGISGKDWTNEVLKLCQEIGLRLARDDVRDGRVQCRFYACHAEKQLVAYFLKHHAFLLQSDLGERGPRPRMAPKSATLEEFDGASFAPRGIDQQGVGRAEALEGLGRGQAISVSKEGANLCVSPGL